MHVHVAIVHVAVVIVSEREVGGGLVIVACCGIHVRVHVYPIQGYMHDVMLYKYMYTHKM